MYLLYCETSIILTRIKKSSKTYFTFSSNLFFYLIIQDIALLNLANVLHKSGELSDAALVTDMALQASTNMVTVHFAMANILAAKVIIFFSFSKNK